jgi:Transcriptional regulator/sugar kinase
MSEISSGRRASQPPPSSAARVLELIASGQALSRAELAAELGAAPSTISSIVGQLVERGLVAEYGTGASTGGRPRKLLRLGGADEFAVAADLGGRHARIGVVRPQGVLSEVSTVPFEIAEGPEQSLARLAATLEELAARQERGVLRAVGVSLPGPVDIDAGMVDLPSRMPGWNRFPVVEWLEQRFALPVVAENDANCMAVAEHAVHPVERRQSITVKAGTAIGAGIIVDGRLYRGATGAAGDITHVRIDAAGDTPCSCGNTGCLETVASGAGIVRTLREAGVEITNTEDIVRLTSEANPIVTRAVRRAGKYLGEVLSANVNFFNPDAVYIGGVLSTLEPFVAAVRSQLYEGSHPLVTQHLTIERSSLGADAGLIGIGHFALQKALARALDTVATPSQPRTKRTNDVST